MSPQTPSDDQIAEWKQEYGEIFSADTGSDVFIFRKITFSELDAIMAIHGNGTDADIEDGLVGRAVLWPLNTKDIMDEIKPGIISTLAENIRDVSNLEGGVESTRKALDRSREKMSGFRGEMVSFIMFGLPQYKAEDLNDITFDDMTDLVALAEKVLQLKQASEGVDGPPVRMEIYSEEEIAEMNKKKISDKGNATLDDPIARKLLGKV